MIIHFQLFCTLVSCRDFSEKFGNTDANNPSEFLEIIDDLIGSCYYSVVMPLLCVKKRQNKHESKVMPGHCFTCKCHEVSNLFRAWRRLK